MRTALGKLQNGQHAGLLLQRYAKDLELPERRRELLEAARSAVATAGVPELYKEAFERRCASFDRDSTTTRLLLSTSDGRVIIGLGSQNVLETGLTLQHTYGTPIIPGSALKGLAAHYCDQVWGRENPEFRRPTPEEDKGYGEYLRGKSKAETMKSTSFRTIFGSTDDGGCITFHDAWITPESLSSSLCLDVMTPHHKNWQLGPDNEGFAPPTDFDSPTPISFLSVSGAFDIRLSWRGPRDDEHVARPWLELASKLLTEALAEWGVGGKTNSGYGRLGESKPPRTRASVQKGAPAAPRKVPNAGAWVEVELLEERTKKGGWKAKHAESGLEGPINNSGDVPNDKKAGDRVELVVASANQQGIAFRYPTPKDIAAKQQKPKGGGGANRKGQK